MEKDFRESRLLGKSGLNAGRIGFGSSFGAPASAYERGFELGCNYFYWGSLRREGMAEAIRHIAGKDRQKIVVVLQSYSRYGLRVAGTVESGLRRLKLEYADVLLLGCQNRPPRDRLMDAALRLKEQGKVRYLQISAHHRPVFQQYIPDSRIDLLMVRYNAAHRGAEWEVFPHLQKWDGLIPGIVTYTATRWRCLLQSEYMPPGVKKPTAADCYRFVLSNPNVDVCLCGPGSAEELEANLKALELGPMSPEEMEWMRKVGDHVHRVTKGIWWNPFMQKIQ